MVFHSLLTVKAPEPDDLSSCLVQTVRFGPAGLWIETKKEDKYTVQHNTTQL